MRESKTAMRAELEDLMSKNEGHQSASKMRCLLCAPHGLDYIFAEVQDDMPKMWGADASGVPAGFATIRLR